MNATLVVRATDVAHVPAHLTQAETLTYLDAPPRYRLTDAADGVYAGQFTYFALTRADATTRTEIALAVALVVAKYLSDETRLFAPDDRSLAEVCEAYVLANATEAEGTQYSDTFTGPCLITATLHAMGLLDDYLRMKRGDQAWAFEDLLV